MTIAEPDPPLFQLSRDTLQVFAADDQAAVYVEATNSTHWLDEVAWAVFSLLQSQALDATAIKTHLQALFPDDPADEQALAVEAALQDMLRVRLIEARA